MAEGIGPAGHASADQLGGQQLRHLRQAAGLSLQELAGRVEDGEVHLDAAHLQRIETGHIARPAARTLDAVLSDGLHAPYRVRREVLESFGYRLPWTLPTEREIEEGRRLCAHELDAATWPVYLMDYGQRLWAWNRYVPRLMGLPPDDPAPRRFVGLTILDLALNPAVGTNVLVANPTEYLPLMVQMVKLQTQPYAHEPWFAELLARARSWPRFAELWSRLPDDPERVITTQPIVPLEYRVPGLDQPLRFRIVLVYLWLDPRFQMVHWLPFGAGTLRQMARWAETDGEG